MWLSVAGGAAVSGRAAPRRRRARRVDGRRERARRARRAAPRSWPRALRLGGGRRVYFKTPARHELARVALVTNQCGEPPRAAPVLNMAPLPPVFICCWRLCWFRSLWLAAARELGAVTSHVSEGPPDYSGEVLLSVSGAHKGRVPLSMLKMAKPHRGLNRVIE